MNKNLEDLKSRRYRDGNYEIAFRYCLIKVLEDFDERLKTIENKMGLFPLGQKELPKEQRPIISGRMGHLEIGARIGKSREGPKPTKSGHGIRPKTKRPRT